MPKKGGINKIAVGGVIASVGAGAGLYFFLQKAEGSPGNGGGPKPVQLGLDGDKSEAFVGDEVSYDVTAIRDGAPVQGVPIYVFDNNVRIPGELFTTDQQGRAAFQLRFTTEGNHDVNVADNQNNDA